MNKKQGEANAGSVLAFLIIGTLILLGFLHPNLAKWLLLGLGSVKIIGLILHKGEEK